LLKDLVEQVIALEPALSKRVKAEHVRKSLAETFVKHVLRDRRQIDPTTTELILNEVATTRLAGVGVTDHFLPCVLFHSGGPDEFEVGIVKFTRTSKLGSAISAISNLTSTGHLHQRMIDAIHWFGDAATEFEATSRIIKYISGIERLLFGKFKYGERKTKFANRLTAMCRTFGYDRENRVHGQALSVYEVRSIF
jgi:hypothetical protein